MGKYPVSIYKLFNKVQNYEWGTKNENAFIPKFLGVKYEPDLPYAELWIGAHSKAPSTIMINGEFISLNKVVEDNPNEWLGESVAEKFNNQLPFLLKVLSANQALSIQTHPNKEQAVKMHAADPANYPDDNHKPEIAIALDELYALVGLKPIKELNDILNENPVFVENLPNDVKLILNNDLHSEEDRVREFYKKMFIVAEDETKFENLIDALEKHILGKKNRAEYEEQFLANKNIYGYDVGLLSFFFFNFVKLKEEEAFFTDAGIPHAYLKGDIIECMANSDNVIRAGLTPKFKDVKTLLEVIEYDENIPEILKSTDEKTCYGTSAEEFEVRLVKLNVEEKYVVQDRGSVIIGLISEGEVIVNSIDTNTSLSLLKGESFIVPGAIKKLSFKASKNSKIYYVIVPVH